MPDNNKQYGGEDLLTQDGIARLLPCVMGSMRFHASEVPSATDVNTLIEDVDTLSVLLQDLTGDRPEYAERYWLIPAQVQYEFLREAADTYVAATAGNASDEEIRTKLAQVCDKYCVSGPPYWVNEDDLAADPEDDDEDDDAIADLAARVDTLEHQLSELAGTVAEIQNRKICTCP